MSSRLDAHARPSPETSDSDGIIVHLPVRDRTTGSTARRIPDTVAVAELRAFGVRKPIILTETGAVKPRHTGASELYARDRQGMLLHDMLFAPFFAGAAGTGHVWFWREAIDRPQLWYHFQRFQRAVAGLDPPAEDFQPVQAETAGLRVYALRGRRTLLAWCRDGQNDWRTELEQGTPPRKITGLALDLALLQPRFDLPAAAQVYDPWQDRLSSAGLSGSSVQLPAFERSLVLRITAGGQLPQTR